MESASFYQFINFLVSFLSVPPSLYLLLVVTKEGRNPIQALKEFHPMNLLLRFVFIATSIIALMNAGGSLLALLGVTVHNEFMFGRDILLDMLISVGAWSLLWIYKKL